VVDFRGVDRQISAEGFAKSRAADDFADDALFTGFSFIWTFGHDLERICGFVRFMESLSIAYGTKDTRSYWLKHAIGAVFTILAAVFALATFDVMAFGHWEQPRLLARVTTWSISRSVSGFGRWTASAVLLSLAIDLINFVLPNAKRPWRWLSSGTIFVVLTLVLSSFGFNLYFQYFSSYPRIYGATGGFIVLRLWIYLASVILLVGAETDSEIEASASRWGDQ
jgi:membrane protein